MREDQDDIFEKLFRAAKGTDISEKDIAKLVDELAHVSVDFARGFGAIANKFMEDHEDHPDISEAVIARAMTDLNLAHLVSIALSGYEKEELIRIFAEGHRMHLETTSQGGTLLRTNVRKH